MNSLTPDRIIIKTVCNFYGISEKDLRSKSRKGHLPDARATCAILLKKHFTVNQCEISRFLGQVDVWASVAIPRAETRRDSSFQNNLKFITTKVQQTLAAPLKSVISEMGILALFTENQVKTKVCEYFKITEADLLGKSKAGILDEARPAYCYLLYSHVTTNKTIVGRMMGRKSHTSCIDFLNRAEDFIDSGDKTFNTHIKLIREQLNNQL